MTSTQTYSLISGPPLTPRVSSPTNSFRHLQPSTPNPPASPRLYVNKYPNTYSSTRPVSPVDRDLETQRRLLGVDAFVPSSASPDSFMSHALRPTSPLLEASQLQDLFEAEAAEARQARSSASASEKISARNHNESQVHDEQADASALGLVFSAPARAQPAPVEHELRTTRSRATTVPLPTIEEYKGPTYYYNYIANNDGDSTIVQYRKRYIPQPHIVDLAIEKFGPPPRANITPPPPPRKTIVTRKHCFGLWKTHQEVEEPASDNVLTRWDREIQRSRELTEAAARDNRDYTPRGGQSPNTEISRISSITTGVQETEDDQASEDDEDHCSRGSWRVRVKAYFTGLSRSRSHH